MILTAGIRNVQELLAGDPNGKKFTHILIGTSNVPVNEADSVITDAIWKEILTVNYLPGGIIQFSVMLDATDPEMEINEIGLVNEDGILCYRKIISTVYKSAGVTYAVSYHINVR